MTLEERDEALRAEYVLFGRKIGEEMISFINDVQKIDPDAWRSEEVKEHIRQALTAQFKQVYANLTGIGIDHMTAVSIIKETGHAITSRVGARMN